MFFDFGFNVIQNKNVCTERKSTWNIWHGKAASNPVARQNISAAKVLKEAGICNYSIFYCKDELFGYYECEKGVAYAEKVQAESPIVDRWNEYMKDILELEMDPVTGAQPKLEQVFRLD